MINYKDPYNDKIELFLKEEIATLIKCQTSSNKEELISEINQLITNCFKKNSIQGDNYRCTEMELKEKIVELIYLNTYDTSKEQILISLDYLISQCYIFPHSNDIYYLGMNTWVMPLPFTKDDFSNLFHAKKENFPKEELYQLFFRYMQHIYKHSLKKAIIMRLAHLGFTNFVPLVRYNKSLFLNKDFKYSCTSNNYVLLTECTLLNFLQQDLQLNFDKTSLLSLLNDFWKCPDFEEISSNLNEDIINLPNNNSSIIKNENNTIQFNHLKTYMQQQFYQSQHLLMGFLPIFPQIFSDANYSFSEDERYILYALLGNSIDNLSYISSLIAASYVTGHNINYPIVFFSKTEQNLNNIEKIISVLFNNKIAYLTEAEIVKPEMNLDSLSQKLYGKNAVAILKTDNETLDRSNLNKFTKRYIIRNGTVVMRNPLPVIIITGSSLLCEKLSDELDAKIIEVPHITFDIETVSTQVSYEKIRQSLLLYGLSNFPKRFTNLKKWSYKETILENFFRNFIEYSEKGYVTKKDLKDSFMKYVRSFDENIDIKPIAICNFLMNRGYNGKKKKRPLFAKNPVAVIMNIKINQTELARFDINDDADLVFKNPDFGRMIQLLEAPRINSSEIWNII